MGASRETRARASSTRMPKALLARCDVLLVTATDTETSALRSALLTRFHSEPVPRHGDRRTYMDYGILNGARVVHVQSEAGSGTPGGSAATVGDGIDEVDPYAIVMVGIAFGMKQQEIGTILVSKQLQDYEVQRVGTSKGLWARIARYLRWSTPPEVITRGDRVTASVPLLSRFGVTKEKWSGSTVEIGLMVSGEKLVDNVEFRESLLKAFPEALGGEMEGRGLYVEAKDRAQWIIIKAVCDWADGQKHVKKHERQIHAANQAANFVALALSEGGFNRERKNESARELGVSIYGRYCMDKTNSLECGFDIRNDEDSALEIRQILWQVQSFDEPIQTKMGILSGRKVSPRAHPS